MQSPSPTTNATTAALKEKIADNALHQTQLHEVTALVAELRQLQVRYNTILSQEGLCDELQLLEDWLDTQRKGPVPASIISESGISWLSTLRDKMKLSADEAQRLEGEGGNPSSKEQIEKIEEMLKAVRRIDRIIDESSAVKHH